MKNYFGKEINKSAVIENGAAKRIKDLKHFHTQSKLHKEFCSKGGFLESLCTNANIFFGFFVSFSICFWAFLIWFVSLFMWTRKKDVSGQLALITGGANGLGRELCLRFALQGCDIAIVDIDLENAKLVAKEIRKISTVTVKGYKVDVSKHLEIDILKQKIDEDFGHGVDILVNNAGIMPLTSFDDDTEVYEKCINVNFMSHIWLIRAFLPSMVSNSRGHIVAVSSEASFSGGRFGSIYCPSKVAVRALMESLRDDLNMRKVKGVQTSCVMPYAIATEGVELDRFNFLIPPICPNKAADILVDNVLRNNMSFTIPKSHLSVMTLVRTMPEVMKYKVLDYILPRFVGLDASKCGPTKL